MRYCVTVAGRTFDVEVDHDQLVRVNGLPLYVDFEQIGGLPVYSLALDDAGYVVFVEERQKDYRVEVQGRVYPVEVQSQQPRLASRTAACSDGRGRCLVIRAPLAGSLISLPVTVNTTVKAGQVVAVVESMKMKMDLKSPQTGVVEMVCGQPDQDVSQGEPLVTIRTS
jgi:biotin carboxyl carrier protein